MLTVGEYIKVHGHEPIVPTPRLLWYWWNRINDELFSGAATVDKVSVVPMDWMADCDGEDLRVSSTWVFTRAVLLSTLAHEMIHVLQWHRSRPLDHGKFFQIQATRLQKALGVAVR